MCIGVNLSHFTFDQSLTLRALVECRRKLDKNQRSVMETNRTFYISGYVFLTHFHWPAVRVRCKSKPNQESTVLTNLQSAICNHEPSTCPPSGKKLCIALTLFPRLGQKLSNSLNTEYFRLTPPHL